MNLNNFTQEALDQPSKLLTTAEFAAQIRQSPLTVRKNLCEKGHHLGARPLKLENGRLLWKLEDLEAILSGGKA